MSENLVEKLRHAFITRFGLRDTLDALSGKLDSLNGRLDRIQQALDNQSGTANERSDRLQQALDNQSTTANERWDRLREALDNQSTIANERWDRLRETLDNQSTTVNERWDRLQEAVDNQSTTANERWDRVQQALDNQSTTVNERWDRLREMASKQLDAANERSDRLQQGLDNQSTAANERWDRVQQALDDQSTKLNQVLEQLDRISLSAISQVERQLSADRASSLPAGASHYRPFVGPPDRYDFMSATQFSLLFALGLRETCKVLDFGCGSLRLGRLLIPFLREECYFGIEPNRWLIDDAIANELGDTISVLKRPRFSYRDDFDCSEFGTKFDFVVAQSIITHAGPDIACSLLRNFGDVMGPQSICVFTYRRAEVGQGNHAGGWRYPEVVSYEDAQIEKFCSDAGLLGKKLAWYHPSATWFIAARSADRLPSDAEMGLLRGAVVGDPQFADSCLDARL